MIYLIENGKISVSAIEQMGENERLHYWGIMTAAEFESIRKELKLTREDISNVVKSTKFESHDGFDYICINVLNYKDVTIPFCRVCIYARKNLLIFVSDDNSFVRDIVADISDDVTKPVYFEKLLYAFFDKITENDAGFLESIEQEIEDLEDALLASEKNNCVKEISSIRKRLMALKRYYEQLLNVLDAIQENENDVIDNKSMRYFKIFAGRVDRLYHSVLNLRDYVTQVREAYQAQVDINLNSIMKLFTVITAIFSPLTLLVGWYGMNLQMPEFGWAFGYPMVIGLSVIVVIICIILFKRNKWFK